MATKEPFLVWAIQKAPEQSPLEDVKSVIESLIAVTLLAGNTTGRFGA